MARTPMTDVLLAAMAAGFMFAGAALAWVWPHHPEDVDTGV